MVALPILAISQGVRHFAQVILDVVGVAGLLIILYLLILAVLRDSRLISLYPHEDDVG